MLLHSFLGLVSSFSAHSVASDHGRLSSDLVQSGVVVRDDSLASGFLSQNIDSTSTAPAARIDLVDGSEETFSGISSVDYPDNDTLLTADISPPSTLDDPGLRTTSPPQSISEDVRFPRPRPTRVLRTSRRSWNLFSREVTISYACNNYPEFCDRRYSDITEICAHNSPFAENGNLASNQAYGVLNQLNDGIRMCKPVSLTFTTFSSPKRMISSSARTNAPRQQHSAFLPYFLRPPERRTRGILSSEGGGLADGQSV